MLSIPLTTLAWIVQRAREFDGKDGASVEYRDGPDDGNDNPLEMLEERSDDTAEDELASWIGDLSEAQQAELVALFWLGRHGGDAGDYADFLDEAEGQQGARTARYLLGSPHLADHLESGLEALGYDIAELEAEIA